MDDDGVPTLDEVIGRAVRTLRERKEMAQDALARACRRKGLKWGRSSIAMLEAGRRSCSISELLIVASALDAPLRLIVSGECLPDRPDTAMLTTTTAANLAAISEALVGRADRLGIGTTALFKIGWEIGQDMSDWSIESGDADQKAARGLDISTEELMSRALRLWQRSLTAERERRVDDDRRSADDQQISSERPMTIAESSSGRSLTAERQRRADGVLVSANDERRALRSLRGRITRELLKELRAANDRPDED
jgi:transcriptional regulator with XRE-family HTH domain